jgi:hypothetical protein
VQECLGAFVVARRATLDEVRREGERRPGEGDERRAAELADELAHRLAHIADVVGLERPQPRHVRGRSHRLRHDGADARHDVEVDPDRLERQHDVAEQDRCVDAVAAYRLERDLGDEVGPRAGLEHPDARADGAVLRQAAPRLAHEPHRRARNRLATAGARE